MAVPFSKSIFPSKNFPSTVKLLIHYNTIPLPYRMLPYLLSLPPTFPVVAMCFHSHFRPHRTQSDLYSTLSHVPPNSQNTTTHLLANKLCVYFFRTPCILKGKRWKVGVVIQRILDRNENLEKLRFCFLFVCNSTRVYILCISAYDWKINKSI